VLTWRSLQQCIENVIKFPLLDHTTQSLISMQFITATHRLQQNPIINTATLLPEHHNRGHYHTMNINEFNLTRSWNFVVCSAIFVLPKKSISITLLILNYIHLIIADNSYRTQTSWQNGSDKQCCARNLCLELMF